MACSSASATCGRTSANTLSSSANPRAWISGPPRDLTGDRVDHDHNGDEAFLTEDPAVLQRRLCDAADIGTVHVDVPARDRSDHAGDAVDQVDDDSVLGPPRTVLAVADYAALLLQGRVQRVGAPAEIEKELTSVHLGGTG